MREIKNEYIFKEFWNEDCTSLYESMAEVSRVVVRIILVFVIAVI